MNSLMKNIKAEASKNPPLLYKKYITLPLFLSQDRDEEMAKMTDGRVAMFSHDVVPHLLRTKPDPDGKIDILNCLNTYKCIIDEGPYLN